jgi:hypothetical protein
MPLLLTVIVYLFAIEPQTGGNPGGSPIISAGASGASNDTGAVPGSHDSNHSLASLCVQAYGSCSAFQVGLSPR